VDTPDVDMDTVDTTAVDMDMVDMVDMDITVKLEPKNKQCRPNHQIFI
jgi:hypothetical protein